MRIIGQNINSSSPWVRRILEGRDEVALFAMAAAQAANGAAVLDINADLCKNARDALLWAAKVLAAAEYTLSIDSASAGDIAFAYQNAGLTGGLVNSVRLGENSAALLLPAVVLYGAGVVAMPIDGAKTPASTKEYMTNAMRMLDVLKEYDVPDRKIYMDILVMPAYVTGCADPLENARALRRRVPDIHIIAGVSNVSYGLPQRQSVNRIFLQRCMENGADSFILDALDADTMRVCREMGAPGRT